METTDVPSLEDSVELVPDLRNAAMYRLLSLLYFPPTQGLQTELQALATEVGEPYTSRVRELCQKIDRELPSLYHQLIGATGQCRDCEADYEVNALGGKGPLLADVAGFYKAFAYNYDFPVSHDHIAIELGFLGWLDLKTAFAKYGNMSEQENVCREAKRKFVQDHFGRWVITFFDKVRQAGEGTFYEDAVRLSLDMLAEREPYQLLPSQVRPRVSLGLPVLNDNDDECGLPPNA